ncbi:MAG TPA: gamma-glutamyl-gamma-aminobutyrate hydrolase family protein [Thermoleophilaceae bacterium]
MTPRPLIGVSTSELRAAEGAHFAHHSEPPRRMLALGVSYLDAVAAAGAIPVILAPLPARRLEAIIERLDGICLSGGPDLEPACYGSEAHPELGPTEPEVDLFELGLVRAARRRRLPILAICRGMQVLNVARGGTLVQHLPDLGDGIAHRQPSPASEPSHGVALAAESRLARLVGAERIDVNSFHHQAIDRLGAGLEPVAWADDGVIEAVEAPGDAFTLGVQWHAECLTDRPEHAGLFMSLVDAAEEHAGLAQEKAA